MGTPHTGPSVTADGAGCRLRPSPTAYAVRLEGLRARDGAALDALLKQLPEPPWDAEVAVDDALVGLLGQRGFEVYAKGAVMARPVDGVPKGHAVGIEFVPYRNDWAEAFTLAETAAMEGVAAFRELGSPSGYEWGEGQGAFWIARDAKGRLLGFAHADLPDGWIDWLGVVPDARRQGIGRGLIAAVARQVGEASGTHLVAFAEDGTAAAAFLGRLGFTERGRRALLIRRAA
ncbi:MAG: GNAT family N-acetyltransferase [Thermoleophilia bacterium]|nr:GNAT family N-acetyltransferase [Thermoleophilia bacterium]